MQRIHSGCCYILTMKADYLFTLAKMLPARELGDEAVENDLLDEFDDLWAEMTDSQRMKLNAISAEVARREVSLRELPYWRVYVYAQGVGPSAWHRSSET